MVKQSVFVAIDCFDEKVRNFMLTAKGFCSKDLAFGAALDERMLASLSESSYCMYG